MNSELLLEAFNYANDEFLYKADEFLLKPRVNRRRTYKTLLIAAIIVSLLTGSAYAIGNAINSPRQAWEITQQQIQALKDIGILSETVSLNEQPRILMSLGEQTGDEYWFGRIWKHRYAVGSNDGRYNINLETDTLSGKISKLSIEDSLGESYGGIIPTDVSLGDYCGRLAEYWGFIGYTISDTHDEFYDWDIPAPDTDTLLIDIPDEYYVTVFFEGDQSGAPMYIQKSHYESYYYFTVGTNHLVG